MIGGFRPIARPVRASHMHGVMVVALVLAASVLFSMAIPGAQSFALEKRQDISTAATKGASVSWQLYSGGVSAPQDADSGARGRLSASGSEQSEASQLAASLRQSMASRSRAAAESRNKCGLIKLAADPSGVTCSGNGWTYDRGTLTVTTNSGASGHQSSYSPHYIYRDDTGVYLLEQYITKVVVAKGVTQLGQLAFMGMENMTSVSLPSTLTYIGDGAFYACTSLPTVSIPKSVKVVGELAFARCPNLKTAKFAGKKAKLVGVGPNAFPGTTKLVKFPKTISKLEDGSYGVVAKVKVTATENYRYAFEILNLVNKERKARSLPELKMDKKLLAAAMKRASEIVLHYDHTRPNSLSCFSAEPLMMGENIAAGNYAGFNPKKVMKGWMNSPGHKANILGADYTTIGVGAVKFGGSYYYVQSFGTRASSEASKGAYRNKRKTSMVEVFPNNTYYRPSIKVSSTKLSRGGRARVSMTWDNGFERLSPPISGLKAKISNRNVVSYYKNGTLKAKKRGTAKVLIYFPGYEKGGFGRTFRVV